MMWPLQSPTRCSVAVFPEEHPPLHLQQLHIKLLHGDLTFILLISHESKVSLHRRWRRLTVKDVYALLRKMGAVITLWGGEFLSPSDITAHEYDLWKAVSQEPRGGVQTWRQISPPDPPPLLTPTSLSPNYNNVSSAPNTSLHHSQRLLSRSLLFCYYSKCLNWTLDLPAFTS